MEELYLLMWLKTAYHIFAVLNICIQANKNARTRNGVAHRYRYIIIITIYINL